MGFRLRQSNDTWSQLNEVAPEQRVQSRDVYRNQQIARSRIDAPQTMATRLVLVWFVAVATFVAVWFILSVGQFFAAMASGEASIPVVTNPPAAVSTPASSDVPPSGSTSTPGGSSSVPDAPGDVSNEDDDWGTVFDDELPVEDGAGADAVSAGVDATGASAPTSDAYAAARGLSFEQFRDRYFRATQGGFITMYVNRVTGETVTNAAVYEIWDAVTGGNQDAFVKLYGDDASMGSPGSAVSDPDPGVQTPDVPGDVSTGQVPGDVSSAGPGVPADSSSSSSGDVSSGVVPGGVSTDVPSGELTSFSPFHYMLKFTFTKFFWSLLAGAVAWLLMYAYMRKNLDAQNAENNVVDINQYPNDQHIALPEEVQREFDWFPDVGAHSPVQVSSMISHMALQNKGLRPVPVTRRAEKDVVDSSGEVVYLKGEVLTDDDGLPIVDTKPLIDEKFSEALFEASGVLKPAGVAGGALGRFFGNPDAVNFRKRYDATQIPYNPGNKNRDRLKDAETVADMINKYWTFPPYEPQRPSGAYIVDTEPVNTMVLAITRAGKGNWPGSFGDERVLIR